MNLDDQDVAEFLEWKKTKHSPLDEACRQIRITLERPYSRGFEAVMPVMAYRVLAEAFLLLREEIRR
jgi:hypothetical protein